MNLLRGLGEPQNLGEALSRFKKAAGQSNPLAQYHLAGMHQEGHGVPKNIGIAKK